MVLTKIVLKMWDDILKNCLNIKSKGKITYKKKGVF